MDEISEKINHRYMINDEGYATYVLCNWGLRSKIKMGEKKATSLHRYADLIQGWEEVWMRRWVLPRRDQLWNDQQWRVGERQRISWKMQHFEGKKLPKAMQLRFYVISSICRSWRGKIIFLWSEMEHSREPESTPEEVDHEWGGDDGPSHPATIWLTRTHI